MIYICGLGIKSGSVRMRGAQICTGLNEIGIQAVFTKKITADITNSIIIFLKYTAHVDQLCKNTGLWSKLKSTNKILFDTIDIVYNPEIYTNGKHYYYRNFHTVITPSIYFHKTCPNSVYIPHHYDPRLANVCITEKINKILYCGEASNFIDINGSKVGQQIPHITIIHTFDHLLAGLHEYKKYAYHISFYGRSSPQFLAKPITKIATAAALDAIAVCVKMPETVYWLGEEYPFYVAGTIESLNQMVKNILNNEIPIEKIEHAKNKMSELKKTLDLKNIVEKFYKPLLL